MKFALLSDALPPHGSGQAIVIRRLLEILDPADYCLISARNLGADSEWNTQEQSLPGKYICLPPEVITRGYSLGLPKLHGPRFFSLLSRLRARKLAQIVKTEKCEAIVACTDTLLDVPAGFRASRLAGVRFYAYVFDDYKFKWLASREVAFAQSVEPDVFPKADGIIVPNEFMRDALRSRYGVEPTLIRNACDLDDYALPVNKDVLGANTGEFSIVYTGAVYDAHYNAIRNLLSALEQSPKLKARLHLYTVFPRQKLVENGLRGDNIIYHDAAPPYEMPAIQRAADILFLPLAFRSGYSQLINTSNPLKMGEYLASNKPILVHAPPDSFLTWYFREHECGLVVDSEGPEAMANAVERLLTDHDLRDKLSANALQRARTDFNLDDARSRFAQLLEIDIRNGK